ncbi:hypothetical protein AVEN_47526-1 [Araneus ventricosus]|uniref:Uncharacterized protein n=1 Tax=Araneus ventricosus TaxID=182803 RepID=A0A4Y2FDW9_ARAVE|nr:hypothetical protein AVEN_47526-1 [Araneus ventricosus]
MTVGERGVECGSVTDRHFLTLTVEGRRCPLQTIVVIGQTIPIQLQGVERKVILNERRNHLNHCLFSVVPHVLRDQNGELWEKKACRSVHGVAIR